MGTQRLKIYRRASSPVIVAAAPDNPGRMMSMPPVPLKCFQTKEVQGRARRPEPIVYRPV
jgi:hypothetical protein